MAQVVAQTERLVAASPQRVRAFLVDYQNNRPRILPAEYFRDYRVEQGGDGAGTVISYRLRAGGRERVSDACRRTNRGRADPRRA